MNQSIEEDLHQALLVVKEKVDNKEAAFGLCHNVKTVLRETLVESWSTDPWEYIDEVSDYMCSLFQEWEHFTGYTDFPVPSTDMTLDPEGQYAYLLNYPKDFYYGEYGDLRKKLLDFLIEKTK